MIRRRLTFAVALLAALGLSSSAAANDNGPTGPLPEFFEGVRAAGAGSSHTAVTSGVDSLYQNPAGVARAPMYIVDGGFSYGPTGAIIGGGIADSVHNPDFALGVAWNYFFGTGDHDSITGHDGRLAVGIPVVPEQVSIGAGVRYLRFTDTNIPITDDDETQALIRGLTFDVGVNLRLAESLHLGLKGENLIDHCADDDRCRGATPTRITAGAGLGFDTQFLISAEGGIDLTSSDEILFDFGAGAEYLANHAIPLRIGFQRRAFLDRNLLTFGLGWRSEEFGIDMAYRHDLRNSSEVGYLSMSFSLYMF